MRSAYGCSSAAAGRDLYRHAAVIIAEAQAAEALVQGRLAEPSGTVRLTASVPTTQLWLADRLPELATTWPRIRLELHATDGMVDVVRDGFDLAIRDHFSPLPDSDLIQRRLGYDPSIIVASPAYLERRGRPSAPGELAMHDGLLTPGESPWRVIDGDGAVVEVTCAPRFVADESTALLRAAAAGLGLACLPASLCAADIAQGALERVLAGHTAGGVTTTLLAPARRLALPAVRAVADFVTERWVSR